MGVVWDREEVSLHTCRRIDPPNLSHILSGPTVSERSVRDTTENTVDRHPDPSEGRGLHPDKDDGVWWNGRGHSYRVVRGGSLRGQWVTPGYVTESNW